MEMNNEYEYHVGYDDYKVGVPENGTTALSLFKLYLGEDEDNSILKRLQEDLGQASDWGVYAAPSNQENTA